MNWKVISRNIGYALLVSALFMFLSIIVSIAEGNDSALAALIISFTITFIVGVFPFIFVRRTNVISLKEGYVIISLSWILCFIFGMLPYALWGGPFTLQNAFFESVSGFTTCGATILDNVEGLPNSLLFWRASTHFIGGLGVVVFLLLIIPSSSPMRMRLTRLELSSLSKGGYSSRPGKVVFVFAYVYIGLFVVATLFYMIAGMSFFDAICHAMSVVSTGGFSTKNLSIAAFNSFPIELVTVILMFVSSLHFGLIYLSIINRSFKPLKNPIVKFYTIWVLVVALLMALHLKIFHIVDDFPDALWGGIFSTVSIATTTGFGIIDNSQWPFALMMLFVFPAIVCGCSGSTTGGIKSDRAILFAKSVGRYLKSILHPSELGEIRIGKSMLRDDNVFPHILYIVIFLCFIFVSTILCLISGLDAETSLLASVMSLGDVGPACGEMGNFGSFNSAPFFAKMVLCVDMFLGRVEIYPVLAVVAMVFDRRR